MQKYIVGINYIYFLGIMNIKKMDKGLKKKEKGVVVP